MIRTFKAASISAFVLLSCLAAGATSAATADVAGVVSQVNSRNLAASSMLRFAITISEAAGASRERSMSVYRRRSADELQTAMFFTSPSSVQGTALLVRDYDEAGRDDGLWLYLPATRNVRRIAPGGRGEQFFSTDFSLFEVSTDTRLRDDLMSFEIAGSDTIDGAACLRLDATPRSADLVREFGYGRAEYWIDEALMIPRRVVLWSENGTRRKEIRFEDIRQDGRWWTVHRRTAENLVNGHKTVFVTSDVQYEIDLPDSLFSEAGLTRGPPSRIGPDKP